MEQVKLTVRSFVYETTGDCQEFASRTIRLVRAHLPPLDYPTIVNGYPRLYPWQGGQ